MVRVVCYLYNALPRPMTRPWVGSPPNHSLPHSCIWLGLRLGFCYLRWQPQVCTLPSLFRFSLILSLKDDDSIGFTLSLGLSPKDDNFGSFVPFVSLSLFLPCPPLPLLSLGSRMPLVGMVYASTMWTSHWLVQPLVPFCHTLIERIMYINNTLPRWIAGFSCQ